MSRIYYDLVSIATRKTAKIDQMPTSKKQSERAYVRECTLIEISIKRDLERKKMQREFISGSGEE